MDKLPQSQDDIATQEPVEGYVRYVLGRNRLVRRVFDACLITEIVIVLGDLLLNYLHLLPWRLIRRVVNITREDSVANFFSSVQFLLCAGVLWLIFFREQADSPKPMNWGWAILAIIFMYLGMDDATRLHERIGGTFEQYMDTIQKVDTFFPTYAWQLVFAPVLLGIGLYILYFVFRRLKDWHLKRMILGGLVCFAVAVGLDALEGMNIPALETHRVLHYMKLVEELLEMFGTTLLLVTFVEVLLPKTQPLVVNIEPELS